MRKLLLIFLTIIIAGLYPSISIAYSDSTKRHPNIILIMTDDQGWGDVGFNGHPVIKTPNLDHLATNGLIFSRFYAGAPSCSPTRATLLTGRHHARMKIDNAMYRGETSQYISHIPNQELTIAELAKTQGYITGHFGKWHVGTLSKWEDDRLSRRGEYEHYSPPWENGYDVAFAMENYIKAFNPVEYKFHTGPEVYNPFPKEYLTDKETPEILMDQVENFITDAQTKKNHFFMTLWFGAPHRHSSPLKDTAGVFYPNPNDTTYDAYNYLHHNEREYYTVISAVDKQIGRLIQLLKALKLEENTLIIFNSDNGPEPQTRHFGTTGPYRDKKGRFYEGGIRVPAFAFWKNKIEAGKTTSYPAVTSDILPTLLDLWQIEMPDDRPLDGISMLPAIFNDKKVRNVPIPFELEMISGKAWVEDTFKIVNPKKKGVAEAAVFNIPEDQRRWELYNIWADPAEQRDLSLLPQYKGQLNQLVNHWDDWWETVESSRQGEDYDDRIKSYTNLKLVSSPVASLRKGEMQHPNQGSLIVEKQHFTLNTRLVLNDNVLPAGTVLNSFLLHYDSSDEVSSISATIQFDDPILAVVTQDDLLAKTNHLTFGQPRMPAHTTNDTISVDLLEEINQIKVYGKLAKDKLKQIRILTLSSLNG